MAFDSSVTDDTRPEAFTASAQALEWAARQLETAGIETPRFEAQLLLALALDVSRTAVVAGLHPILEIAEQKRFLALVEARLRHVPLAYLRGNQEFYGQEFHVSQATLIPRPETELLVDFACKALGTTCQPATLIDVGTGSGCIAIAALAHLPDARGIALDVSVDALALAQLNAETNGVRDRIRFLRTSLLDGMRGEVDLILSNPPYIPSQELAQLQPEVRDHEPHLALDGGEDGLSHLRRLTVSAKRVLKPGGWIAVECALGQAGKVADLFVHSNLSSVEIRRDLAGIERMVSGRRT